MNFFMGALLVICVVILVLMFLYLGYLLTIEIRKCFLTYDKQPVTVKVVDKRHVHAYTTTTMIRVGKTTVPQLHHHPAKFEVILSWRNENYPVDDEEVFNELEIGDTVLAMANIGYNKAGVEKDVYLSFD